MRSFARICCVALSAFIPSSIAFAENLQATAQHQDEVPRRIDWWRKARFGMFIHWGLRTRLLARRDESVALWREIVGLADAIHFADDRTAEHVRVSCRYGLHLFRIYQAAWHLAALTTGGPRREVDRWLAAYDEAWRDYRALPATSTLTATLYQEKGSPHAGPVEGVDKFIARFRAVPSMP